MQEPNSVVLFRLWRRAEERAAAAERELFDAAIRSGTGGPSPTEEQWVMAKGLRAEASELFKAAMAEVKRSNAEAVKLTVQLSKAQKSGFQ
jgi:hypothetical protein